MGCGCWVTVPQHLETLPHPSSSTESLQLPQPERLHLERQEDPLPPSPIFFPAWQGLQEESLDLWAQVEATKPLIQGNPQHQQLMDQLCIDCQALQRSLDVSAGLSCSLTLLAVKPCPCPSFPCYLQFAPVPSPLLPCQAPI